MTDVTTTRRAGLLFLRWTCSACGNRNERAESVRPWYCLECGRMDREVEAFADDLASRNRGEGRGQ